jgi:TP901 family phage tail tape measure protein
VAVTAGEVDVILRLRDEMTSAIGKAVANLDKAGGNLKKFGASAETAGRALLPLTAAIAAVGIGAAKAAIDFESSFAGVRKTVKATEAEFAALSAGFREMAKTIPVSVNELNSIGAAAGQLGIKQENVLGFTKVMAQLAVTTNLSSQEASMSLAQLANITQMPQTEFDRLGSTVVILGNNMATTEGKIVDFGLRIAGAGQQAGLSEPQILAIGAAMASVGVEAEAGGTAVQKVLLDMLKSVVLGGENLAVFARTAQMTSAQFKEAFQKDAGGAFLAFVEGLGAQGQQAIQTMADLGLEDQRLLRSFLALSGAGDKLRVGMDLANKGWAENTALTKEAAERFKTMESRLTLLWNRVKDVGITLGFALAPAIEDVMAAVNGLIPMVEGAVKWFTGLPGPVKTGALALIAMFAALAPLLLLFGSVARAVGTFTTALTWLAASSGGVAVTKWLTALAVTLRTQVAVAFDVANVSALRLLGTLGLIAAPLAAAGMGIALLMRQTGQDLARMGNRGRATPLGPAADLSGFTFGALGGGAPVAAPPAGGGGLSGGVRQLSEDVQKLRDEMSGAQMARDIADLAAAIRGLDQAAALKNMPGLLEQLADFAAKGGKLPPALAKIQQSYLEAAPPMRQFFLENVRLNEAIEVVPSRLEQMKEKTEALAQMAGQVAAPAIADVTANVIRYAEAVERAARRGAAWGQALQGFAKDLGPTVLAALTGGGNVGDAVGGLAGQHIGTALTKQLTGKNSLFGAGTFGKIMGDILPGIGTLLGGLISKGLGALVNAMQPAGKFANDLRDAFKGTFGDAAGQGMAAAMEKFKDNAPLMAAYERFLKAGTERTVQRAIDDIHRLTAEAEAALAAAEERMRRVGEHITEVGGILERFGGDVPTWLHPMVESLLQATGLSDEMVASLRSMVDGPDWKALQEIAEEYGISLEGLGKQFQQAKLNDLAVKYAADFEMLMSVGADVGEVLKGMKDEVQALVLQSLQFGTTVPDNMRGLLQALVDAGLLVDEAGLKLVDLSRFNFGEHLESPFDRIAAILEQIRDLLAHDIPAALGTAAEAVGRFPWQTMAGGAEGGWRLPFARPPQTALASGGIVTGPTVALLGEAGPEAVIPLGGGGLGGTTIVIQAWDGESVERWLRGGGQRVLVRAVNRGLAGELQMRSRT